MFSVVIAKDAMADLEDIASKDLDAASDIYDLLLEAKGSQDVLRSLSTHDFGPDRFHDRYHVGPWVAQQQSGRNIWLLKLWHLDNKGIRYRVIYALDSSRSRYYVLGVFERSFNYEPSDPRTKRIVAAYDRLQIWSQ